MTTLLSPDVDPEPEVPERRARRQTARRDRRHALLRRVLRGMASAFLALLVAAGLATFLLLRSPLPPESVPQQTSFLFASDGSRLAAFDAGENRVAVDISAVPPVLIDAVVATEDRKYFEHAGVDPRGIVRALWADVRGKGVVQGGSTITQQYVKNVHVGADRTVWRKAKEVALAVKLERKYDKDEILERYLNTIYLGRGAYGVQAAAQVYFGRDVGQLGLPESAYLAGLIRAPELADARRAPEVASQRRARTLAAMVATGAVTQSQADQADASGFGGVIEREGRRSTSEKTESGTQYFVEYVRRQLVDRFGEEKVYSGGLRVQTTLDPTMQAQAYRAVYDELKPSEPAGALVAIDDTGQVKAMVGGRNWDDSSPVAKVNLATGREGGGSGRQAGSTFKPFLLAEAVRQGYSVRSELPAPASIVLPAANGGKDYTVDNYGQVDYGSLDLIDATRDSVNTVYAQLADVLGPERLVAMAADLGIRSPLNPDASLVLGTADVSVLEMAGAFSTFANRGARNEPQVIVRVETAAGEVLERQSVERTQVLDPAQADVVTHCLQQVVQSGTGTGARLGKPVAGKTGTTQENGDAWFVGYTPKLTAAVWMGWPEGNDRKMTRVRGKAVTGGGLPATIFQRFMTDATKGRDMGTFNRVRSFKGSQLEAPRRSSVTGRTSRTSRTTDTARPRSERSTAPQSSRVAPGSPDSAPRSTLPPSTSTTRAPATGGATTTTSGSGTPSSGRVEPNDTGASRGTTTTRPEATRRQTTTTGARPAG